MSSGASWGLTDNIGNAKPPAQGPGPGGMQNGIENADGNSTLRQQIQLSHILQQQVSFAFNFILNMLRKLLMLVLVTFETISRMQYSLHNPKHAII